MCVRHNSIQVRVCEVVGVYGERQGGRERERRRAGERESAREPAKQDGTHGPAQQPVCVCVCVVIISSGEEDNMTSPAIYMCLLYMCPHTDVYVSSYCYICVLILLYVLYYVLDMCSYCYICVLILVLYTAAPEMR